MVYYNFKGEPFENEHDEEMSRKYGYKYKCVKNIYPNVYKLPKEEIETMTNILRYQGDTMEEAEDILKKHIKEKEPS